MITNAESSITKIDRVLSIAEQDVISAVKRDTGYSEKIIKDVLNAYGAVGGKCVGLGLARIDVDVLSGALSIADEPQYTYNSIV